ncbi:MAG: hypothetical protein WD050_06335 [Actinomycetota bacterium]
MGGTRMSVAERELTVRLDRVEDLFAAPHVDLAKGRLDPQAGMDQIMTSLRAHRLPARVRVTVMLPDETAREGASEGTLRKLVEDFCRANIRRNAEVISSLRREGLLELIPAVLLLFGCLSLSIFLGNVTVLTKPFTRLLVEGSSIVGWVGMWQPLQSLLYDWWPAYRDNKIYGRLLDMDLVVRTEAVP